jgi:hypothetical protein
MSSSASDDDLVEFDDLLSAFRARDPGDNVELTVLRNGHEQTIEVQLGQIETGTGQTGWSGRREHGVERAVVRVGGIDIEMRSVLTFWRVLRIRRVREIGRSGAAGCLG